ncbi:hypothetical protein K3G63_07375 [Hymenobacter sp. HSC-4F20]|uniref:hypothetical protein n=1 Tax=Hymenobacter sp. HSC-4F20 TaxID=2864135 RepID=UPI001C7349CB|nr:hypothetical protein [Hymenobacter sp. HSC-4F20]MBX0290253.1 hypothetical protein [Hymenobacter sp. HSC-4F20]
MTILRTLCCVALFGFTGAGAVSCISPPDYSDTPEIEFKNIYTQRFDRAIGTYDSVAVTVAFKDGDGDLGLNNGETSPPFNEFNIVGRDTIPNKYYNNYFMSLQVQETDGTYSDLPLTGLNFNSRYPLLTPESQGDRKAPLKGDLTLGLKIFQGSIQSFRPDLPMPLSVRFKVYIVDRALHESNTVLTSPITIR